MDALGAPEQAGSRRQVAQRRPFQPHAVIVTGGSSGIGAALARAYAQRGINVVIASNEPDALNKLAQSLNMAGLGSRVIAIPTDVTKEEDVNRLRCNTLREFGCIDVLVNCAGIGQFGWVHATPVEDFKLVLDVNFIGTVLCTKAVLSDMLQRNVGHIVNIASGAALYGPAGMAAYSASKAAIVAFSQALCAELRETGVGVTLVYPDRTRTNFETNAILRGEFVQRRSVGMSPDKVAEAIVNAVARRQRVVMLGRVRLAAIATRLFPGLTERVMRWQAKRWTQGLG